MTPEGACPTCGRVLAVADPTAEAGTADSAQPVPAPPPGRTIRMKDIQRMAAGEGETDEDVKAPWHFKLMLACLALYLGYRAVQLVILIVR
jgi:hypothetical protein